MIDRKLLLDFSDSIIEDLEQLRLADRPDRLPVPVTIAARMRALHEATGYEVRPPTWIVTAYNWLMDLQEACLLLGGEEVA